MKFLSTILVLLSVTFSSGAQDKINDMDTELSSVADKVASQIESQGKKKVAVIDFTDLEGNPSGELGKYVAEQLTVDLVMDRTNFSVLDRANLKKILDEHKLSATGLVDPDNAKKLGQFAGVDALILGTVVPKEQNVKLTVKIITTDTAEIIGATKGEFKNDSDVQQLVSKPVVQTDAESPNTPSPKPEKPSIKKEFGDLLVEAQPPVIVADRQYNLTLTFSNKSSTRKLWVTLSMDRDDNFLKGGIVDSDGNSFSSTYEGISGIAYDRYYNGSVTQSTEIKPGESATATIKFVSQRGKDALQGLCDLQVEFLLATDSSGQ